MDARSWSKASMGNPAGLAGVFNISGGMAPISTAFATPSGSVATDIASDFAAPCRVADMNRIAQIERRH